jgi:hypothetical protein
MADAVTLLLRLHRTATQLLGPRRPSAWALGGGLAWRLLPTLLLVGLLLIWSPAAALESVGGYWLGRTIVLTHDLRRTAPGANRHAV